MNENSQDPGYGYEQPQSAAPAPQPARQHANLGEAMYGPPAPRPQLTTGPIQWDKSAEPQNTYWQTPQGQMLRYWPGFGLVGALGVSPLVARGILAALRDPRLEMMFRK